MNNAVLAAYEQSDFDDGRWTRPVYRRGTGPAVIVIHEIPGLHPLVVRFADHVVAAGMTVYMPSLFGTPGKEATRLGSIGAIASAVCVRREFDAWAHDRSSPIVDWCRALARRAHADCGGRGVGAVGMCFTGNFALAMMTEPAVIAPVLSQPSLPGGITAASRAAIGVSPDEIACAKRRFETENLSMIGLRFHGDRMVPAARFDTLRATFGDRFVGIELDPRDAARSPMPAHSVLTTHLREDGPTKAAEEQVLAFFRERLGVAA
jgi:dienelactone hydrolase